MNKGSLATILGVALLSLAKKGSSGKIPLDDYVKRSTGGTGRVRVDFTFKYKPFWENNTLRCNFDDELWDAQGALDVWHFIHNMSQDMDIDDYDWVGDCYGEDITQGGIEHYNDYPGELYEDYLGCSDSIAREFNIFRDQDWGNEIFIKNYLDWDELEEYVQLYNLSQRLQVFFHDDESEQSLAEEEDLEFEQTQYGWEPIGFNHTKYQSIDGPKSFVEGYVEFDVNDIEDFTFLKARKHTIEEYILKMLAIAYDAFRLTGGASEGRIEIVSIKFSDFWGSNKSKLRRR